MSLEILAHVASTMKPLPLSKVITEDVGKIFEQAVCLALGTEWCGKPFKYSLGDAQLLGTRLSSNTDFKRLFTGVEYIHTAKGGGSYDFTSQCGSHKLSCKSNKSNGTKVASHSIGQAIPETFCERIGIPFTDVATLKTQFQERETLLKILSQLESKTFDAPILYYNKKNDTLQYIKQNSPINWTNYQYHWTRDAPQWVGSCTFKVDQISILEVQFHTKRKNMAVRWILKNLIGVFCDHFQIVDF